MKDIRYNYGDNRKFCFIVDSIRNKEFFIMYIWMFLGLGF